MKEVSFLESPRRTLLKLEENKNLIEKIYKNRSFAAAASFGTPLGRL